jgi:hypothetical protein
VTPLFPIAQHPGPFVARRAPCWRGATEVIYATLMVEILKDNARPEAGAVYGAMDMPWAKLVGQIAQAYGR